MIGKKRLLLTAALFGAAFVSGIGDAEAGKRYSRNSQPQGGSYYIKGSIGATFENDEEYKRGNLAGEIDYNSDPNYSVALGANLTGGVRTEFEVSHRSTDVDRISRDGAGYGHASGELSTWGFMANAAYDFAPQKTFSPYVTAGVGMVRHNLEVNDLPAIGFNRVDDSDYRFAYQAGGGISVLLMNKLHLDTGYRYLGSTDPDFGALDTEYGVHEVTTGLRYSF